MKAHYGIKEIAEKTEQKYIKKVLESVNWRIGDAAELLKIDRSTLFRKMKKYGISRKPTNKDMDKDCC
ncbi:MAG: helix-turn-helix domain-containing protein [candidate division WOR-3 bacterium]